MGERERMKPSMEFQKSCERTLALLMENSWRAGKKFERIGGEYRQVHHVAGEEEDEQSQQQKMMAGRWMRWG